MLMVLLLYKLDWSLEVSLLYRCCCCCYNLLSASPFPLSGCNCTVWLQLHGLAVDGIAKRNRESPTTTFISGLAPPLPLFNLLHSIDNPLTPNSVSRCGRMQTIRHECHVHAERRIVITTAIISFTGYKVAGGVKEFDSFRGKIEFTTTVEAGRRSNIVWTI
jgi:hypothetical protein